MEPYDIRQEAERIIGEDRVPTDVLEELIAQYGDNEEARLANDRRANRGQSIVHSYVHDLLNQNGSGEFDTDAGDLVADLCHALKRAGFNYGEVIDRAESRVEEELQEAGQS